MPDPRPLQIDALYEPAPQAAIELSQWFYDWLWHHGVRGGWENEAQRREFMAIVKTNARERFGVELYDDGSFTLELS